MARALFFGTALGRFKGQGYWYGNCLGGKAGCGDGPPKAGKAELGGRANAEGVGEGSCLGGKASWRWAAEKGAAK